MKYIARRFKMKGGEFCVLRSTESWDAAQRIAFLKAVNAETPFMARGAEDSPEDEALVADMLSKWDDMQRIVKEVSGISDT